MCVCVLCSNNLWWHGIEHRSCSHIYSWWRSLTRLCVMFTKILNSNSVILPHSTPDSSSFVICVILLCMIYVWTACVVILVNLLWWNGIENRSCSHIYSWWWLLTNFNMSDELINIALFYESAHRKALKSNQLWVFHPCA